MPGGDRSGPLGEGPLTGRGMGNCGPNSAVRGRGFRRGFSGGGRGRGWGFGNMIGRGLGFLQGRNRPVDERRDLENYVQDLEWELQEVKNALKEMEQQKNGTKE